MEIAHTFPVIEMAIHSFYVFNRHCECIYYQNFSLAKVSTVDLDKSLPAQPESAATTDGTTSNQQQQQQGWEEQAKLVYGVLFSLRNMCTKLATRQPYNHRSSHKIISSINLYV